jgi:hypothetical protein
MNLRMIPTTTRGPLRSGNLCDNIGDFDATVMPQKTLEKW